MPSSSFHLTTKKLSISLSDRRHIETPTDPVPAQSVTFVYNSKNISKIGYHAHVYIVVFQWMRVQDEIRVMGIYIVGSVDSVRHGTPSERKDSFQSKAYAPKMATPASPMCCGLSCDKWYGADSHQQRNRC